MPDLLPGGEELCTRGDSQSIYHVFSIVLGKQLALQCTKVIILSVSNML